MPQKVNPQQGITDQARIYRKNAGGSDTDITSNLGKMTSLSWNINENSEREADVNSGANYRANTDTLVTVDGSVTFRVSAFDIWRLMGEYNEPGDGTWEVEFTDALPLHRVEVQVQETSSDRVLEIYAVKFGRGEINVDKDGFMVATFDYQAVLDDQGNPLYHFHDDQTITDPGVEGYSKRGFDTEFTIEGTAVGSGQSFTFTYNRDLDADKGIEPNDGRQRRAPTQLIEQLKDFQVNGDVDITDFQVFQETLDADTFPLTSQDRRTEKQVGLGLASGTAGKTTWSGAKLNPLGGELANDADKRQVSIEGTATGATIQGEV